MKCEIVPTISTASDQRRDRRRNVETRVRHEQTAARRLAHDGQLPAVQQSERDNLRVKDINMVLAKSFSAP